jgi:[protein-PII] uridylyltransferase
MTTHGLLARNRIAGTSLSCQDWKERIEAFNRELGESFRSGRPVAELLKRRAQFVDALLVERWTHLLGSHAERLALVAVGGYGRGELSLHSDIDLLVLLDCDGHSPGVECLNHVHYQGDLADFSNFLWDIGLKPGLSVRTVAECVEQAAADQTTITNLLESRLLYGSTELFNALSDDVSTEHMWSSREYFEVKLSEQRQRYAKYHDTAYNLEPNVKEGPGGLRDIQMIGWIIKRHYASRDLTDLIVHGWLTESEYAELIEAQEFLWQIRFALHVLTGKCEDRLLFDHQKDLAREFGYAGHDINECVEHFMQRYFRAVMGVERLNEMLLQLFKEVVLHGTEDFLILPINRYFQSVNSYIEAVHPNVFDEEPLALLQIFLIMEQNTTLLGVRASSIRLIRQHLHLIDDDFRNSPRACHLFMEILRQPRGITTQLRRMNRYGVLAAYLPAFGRVVGRMQYDLFHVYTVDEHTLFVVRNLRRFSLEKYRNEHPLCNELWELIEKPELLYIAALMHDIAKGTGHDHSIAGEEIAEDFCRKHGVSKRDTALVAWLVRNHLLMSLTAQRKDISDPRVIHEFAELVNDQNTLNHLFLLTVADIRATNPNLWNAWRDALLRDLFGSTRWALRRGLENPLERAEKVSGIMLEARDLIRSLRLDTTTTDRVWRDLGEDYFQRYMPEEIAWHTIAIASCHDEDLPLVLLRPMSQRGSPEIFVYAKNQDFIFPHSTAVLDQLGLTIFDAKIITAKNGYVLNSYHVLEQSGRPIRDQLRQIDICNKLRQCLVAPRSAPMEVQRLEPRHTKHFRVPTQIVFKEDPDGRYTVIELVATDRPGLLSKVGQAFNRFGIRLHNAKISTIGVYAEDIFYITDLNNRPLHAEKLRDALRRAIVELVGKI